MEYIISRDNLACCIFVPFDCDNNCPFCASKSMYSTVRKDKDKIYEDIKLLNKSKYIKAYVITGGEPFARLDITSNMVNLMEKPCYINTTLPNRKNIDEVVEFINSNDKVKGISVSRHIGVELNKVAPFSVIESINKPIRINTVINDGFSFDKFDEFVKFYGSDTRLINLRADYTKETIESLKSMDATQTELMKRYKYIGANGSLMSYSVLFRTEEGTYINYHRGMMYSSVTEGDRCYINDIIITPDGKISKDWDYINDPEFNNWIVKSTQVDDNSLDVFGLKGMYMNLDI